MQTRHIYKSSDWAKDCFESLNHPHRPLLLEKILAYAPLESILEIGCNRWPNLYLLAQRLPQAELHGIDINPKAIEIGKEWVAKAGFKTIHLSVGKADKLERFADKSIDLVFTDAILIYLGPDKIQKVVREMQRIARKALVFNEWHQEDRTGVCFYYNGHWVHNYRALLAEHILSPDNIIISKIPKELWGGTGWEEFGATIEARL